MDKEQLQIDLLELKRVRDKFPADAPDVFDRAARRYLQRVIDHRLRLLNTSPADSRPNA